MWDYVFVPFHRGMNSLFQKHFIATNLRPSTEENPQKQKSPGEAGTGLRSAETLNTLRVILLNLRFLLYKYYISFNPVNSKKENQFLNF